MTTEMVCLSHQQYLEYLTPGNDASFQDEVTDVTVDDLDQGQEHIDPFHPVPHERDEHQVETDGVRNLTSGLPGGNVSGQVEEDEDGDEGHTEVDED